MIAVLSGYFKIGFAIGVDDFLFTRKGAPAVGLLPDGFIYCEKPEEEEERVGFGMPNVRLGRGMEFDFTHSGIFGTWKESAAKVIGSAEFITDYAVTEQARREIVGLQDADIKYKGSLTLFSCGIALVEVIIDFNGLAETISEEGLVRFVQTFEVAAYGRYDSASGFQRDLDRFGESLLDYYASEKLTKEAMLCRKKYDKNFDYNFFPAFTILFMSKETKACEGMLKYRESKGDDFKPVLLDSCQVWGSWYIFIEQYVKEEDKELLLNIVRIYTLFFGLCDGLENLLTTKITGLFYEGTGTEDNKQDILIKLHILSGLYANYTDFRSITQDGEVLAIVGILDEQGRIAFKHNNIAQSVEVLNTIQRQIDHEKEKKQEYIERHKDEKVNKFIAIITSFTFISVIADFLNLDQLSSQLIPDLVIRVGVYAMLFIPVIWLISSLFRKK